MQKIEGNTYIIESKAELRTCCKKYIRLCVLESNATSQAQADFYYAARKGDIYKSAKVARFAIAQDPVMAKQWDKHLKQLFNELTDFTVYEADKWLLESASDGSVELLN